MGKYRITSLKKFCMSVEHINDSTFKLMKSLFEKIFSDTLGACFFKVLRGGHRIQPSGKAALLTIWCSEKSEHRTLEIHTRSELYGGLAQLAFLLDKPFWLTASDQRPLVDTSSNNAQAHLIDSWSKVDEIIDSWPNGAKLPDYMDYGGGDAKTAIIIPLKYSGHVFGILNLEFKEHLAFARQSAVKLADIADSLARVIWLRETTESSEEDTHDALEILEDNFDFKCSPLKRAHVFTAYSQRSSPDVMDVIKKVLAGFSEFDAQYWEDSTMSGSIKDQIYNSIKTCVFGVCYLSEKISEDEGQTLRFQDNPNVLYEAGMLQMLHELRKEPESAPSRWIPIREGGQFTTPAPFDFAAERMIIVPRDENGQLQEDAFWEKFQSAVESLNDALDL